MVYLGVDYGRKRTGIAIYIQGIVLPGEPVLGGQSSILQRLGELRNGHGDITVIMGLPLSASGNPTDLSAEVTAFAGRLQKLGYSVELVNETRTSAEAVLLRGINDRKGRIDSLAACQILKRYLKIP